MWPFKTKQQTQPVLGAAAGPSSRATYWTAYANTISYLPQPQDTQAIALMRQGLPILDSAVELLVRLTGVAEVVWERESVQAAWDTWAANCKVAPLEYGINNWLNGQIGRALMFGTAASEILIDAAGREVIGFTHIAPSSLRLRIDPENAAEVIVAQQQSGAPEPVVLTREFIALSSYNPRDDSPYGRSIFVNCPFIGELALEIAHATKLNWNRVGAPSFGVNVELPETLDAGFDVQAATAELLKQIKDAWTEAMTSRKQGGSIKDFFSAGKITYSTIGADGQLLPFDVPWRAALEQIVGATHIPPWMLGLHWSTTERLSEEQAQSLEQVIGDIQSDYTPIVVWAADWWSRLAGYAGTGHEVLWPAIALRDKLETARAAVTDAQAIKTRQGIARQLWADGIFDQQSYADYVLEREDVELITPMDMPEAPIDRPSGGGLLGLAAKSASCLHKAADAPTSIGAGEPPSDERIGKAIRDFWRDMRTALSELRESTWRIFNLPEVARRTTRALTEEEVFEVTARQTATFNRAVELFLERMAGSDRTAAGFVAAETGDGIIQQYERFAHAIGVSRAAELTGAEASAILPERSGAAVTRMLSNAFERLSEQGELRLERILPDLKTILTDAVGASLNPVDVARQMTERFDAYAGWEFLRLARTEIGFAQVTGELDEFRAEGVDTSGVESDPPPWHPNCVLPGTKVAASDILAGYKLPYRGKAVDIQLANGENLSVTENHYLLTNNGFVQAKFLREGDQIIYCADLQGIGFTNPDNNGLPSSIEDIVISFAEACGGTTYTMPVTDKDFHGDGSAVDGKVDIIGTDSFLGFNSITALPKHLSDERFSARDTESLTFAGCSSLTKFLMRAALAADRIMGGRGHSYARFLSHASKSYALRGRASTELNIVGGECPADTIIAPASDSKTLAEFVMGCAGQVEFCDIASIRQFDFTGHVYDLQTLSTLYIANGMLSSNCLCDINVTEDENGNWHAVYEISSEACDLCQAYAGG